MTRQEIADIRREKVKLMLTMGLTISGMAQQLGCARRTISSDIRQIKDDWQLQIGELNPAQLIGELQFESKARARELWTLAQESSGQIKINALRALADESWKMAQFLQAVGIIETTPEKFDIRGAIQVVSAVPHREKEKKIAEQTESNRDNGDDPIALLEANE